MTQVLYTTPIAPDLSDPRQLLAFLLVSPKAFLDPGDDAQTVMAVRVLLHTAKRDVLLEWFRLYRRGRR